MKPPPISTRWVLATLLLAACGSTTLGPAATTTTTGIPVTNPVETVGFLIVPAGQVIGTVGNSGDAAPTSPHIHFGISHLTFPGDWEIRRGEVWPYDYLQAWTRGEAAIPNLPEG